MLTPRPRRSSAGEAATSASTPISKVARLSQIGSAKKAGKDSVDHYSKPDVSSEENSEEERGDAVPDLDQNLATKLKKSNPVSRTSVSAEVYGANNKKQAFKARVIPKDNGAKAKIRATLLKSFLFRALDDKDLETCIDAMEIKEFQYSFV